MKMNDCRCSPPRVGAGRFFLMATLAIAAVAGVIVAANRKAKPPDNDARIAETRIAETKQAVVSETGVTML